MLLKGHIKTAELEVKCSKCGVLNKIIIPTEQVKMPAEPYQNRVVDISK